MSLQLLVLLTLLLLRGGGRGRNSHLHAACCVTGGGGSVECNYLLSYELLSLNVLLLLQRHRLAVQVRWAAVVRRHGTGPRLDRQGAVSRRRGHGVGGAWAVWRSWVRVLVLTGGGDKGLGQGSPD